MSLHEFDPKCPDCRPALVDVRTGKQLALDHPAMIKAHKIWDEELTVDEQHALWRCWVQSSTDPADLQVMAEFAHRMQEPTDENKHH